MEIARADWPRFLDGFSRSHEGWLVTVETAEAGIAAHDLPLEGISTDRGGAIVIDVGGRPDRHLTHTIDRPSRLVVEESSDGVERGLRIEGEAGAPTRVTFRSVVRPEEVDGIP